MPSPDPSWTLVDVRWSGTPMDGGTLVGTIEAMPSVGRFKINGKLVVLNHPFVATINSNKASLTLPASDDPDVNPTGWTWEVTEKIKGRPEVSYIIEVPTADASTGIDLTNVAPTSASVGTPVSLVTREEIVDFHSRLSALEAGDGNGTITSVNGKTTASVVLNADDLAETSTRKWLSATERSKLSGVANSATANSTDAVLKARSNHTGTQTASTISDLSAAVQALIDGAQIITSVNGDLGDSDGAVTVSLNSLPEVNVDVRQYDDDGVLIPNTGMQDGDFLGYDPVTNEVINKPVTGFAPEGWVAPYTLRGISLAVGDTVPADLPDDALIFDESKPTTPLIETINSVPTSGATLTLPAPTVATIHDVTLTANCAITFPTPVAGTRFRLLLRQDATGSRTVTWSSSPKWNSTTNTAPTLSTTATAENVIDFASISGMAWRQVGSMMSYTGSPQPGPTPTVRGSAFSANSGSTNTNTSVSATLPNSIASGDLLYMLVSMSGTSGTFTSKPTINGTLIANGDIVDGTNTTGVAGSGQTFWLIRKVLAGTESGQTITSGVMNATGRPALTGIVIAGGTTTGEVTVNNTKSTVSTSLIVPAISPGVSNALLVHLAGFRSSASTTAQSLSPAASPYTFVEKADHYEGRLDGTNVNFGGYCETRALTGQGGVSQTSSAATYTVQATERSYLIAVPPPVS